VKSNFTHRKKKLTRSVIIVGIAHIGNVGAFVVDIGTIRGCKKVTRSSANRENNVAYPSNLIRKGYTASLSMSVRGILRKDICVSSLHRKISTLAMMRPSGKSVDHSQSAIRVLGEIRRLCIYCDTLSNIMKYMHALLRPQLTDSEVSS
jgi:hypothetical protein